MRIAIDGRELEGKPTGVGRYLKNLMRVWLSGDSSDHFVIYHRDALPDHQWLRHESIQLKHLPRGSVPYNLYWQQVTLSRALRDDKPDVLFAPADSLPLRWNGPSLLTFHDLSYEAHPEWFGLAEGLRRRALAQRSAKGASCIITVSNFTRDELVSRYNVPIEKINVVYHGIDDSLHRASYTSEVELRDRIGLSGQIALVVGSIFERRFPLEIIRAFKFLGDLDIGLVIAGDDRRRNRTDLNAEIRSHGLGDRVVWFEYCSEEDLCGLYRIAGLLISLSLYEGFSLPPLEAMSFGVPVVVSARGAQLEVYGGAALALESEDEETIAAAVRKLACDKSKRKRMIQNGTALVERLTLDRCANRTLELIRKASEMVHG